MEVIGPGARRYWSSVQELGIAVISDLEGVASDPLAVDVPEAGGKGPAIVNQEGPAGLPARQFQAVVPCELLGGTGRN